MLSSGAATRNPAAMFTTSPTAIGASGLASAAVVNQRLAARDGDLYFYALVLFDQPVADGERRADSRLRVVLVCGRRTEKGHDLIADELVDALEYPLDGGAGWGSGQARSWAGVADGCGEGRRRRNPYGHRSRSRTPSRTRAGPIATMRCPLARMG